MEAEGYNVERRDSRGRKPWFEAPLLHGLLAQVACGKKFDLSNPHFPSLGEDY